MEAPDNICEDPECIKQTWFAACLAKNLYSRGVKELVGNKLSAGSAILLSITESDDEE